MRCWKLGRACCWLLLCVLPGVVVASDVIRVGSKNFNESFLLSEIAAQLLEAEGFEVERKFGLGGTLICYQALKNGEIDLYMEYTGTLSQAILDLPGNPGRDSLNEHLAKVDLTLLDEFGFNNTYAIVVRDEVAEQANLRTIGDLAGAADLEMVFSHEFLERDDGWLGMSKVYGLEATVRGIEHGLAYQAISKGAIGVTDAYSTDGELIRYSLRVLEDDRSYFPSYFAAPLVRTEMQQRAQAVLARLAGQIDDEKMQMLNAKVVFDGDSFATVAAGFLGTIGVASDPTTQSMWNRLVKNTLRHLQLTGIALGLAILVGLGLSLLVYRNGMLSSGIIYFCGLLQTVPSIALLALMIPLFGIGMLPAIVALFLYSLLPILRNAITALANVEPTLVKVSLALGLTEREQLRYVRVPLSLPAIFAGVRTAAVISIGTATLAAFIGAGGLGEPIVVGLALDSVDLIMQGAIPAALLAILTEIGFGALERRMTVRR
jgi:osmoprotectant transport system permease protein